MPSSDTTTATAGNEGGARRARRNTKTTSTTRPTAITRVRSTSFSEARIEMVRSDETLSVDGLGQLGLAARAAPP